MSSHWECVTFLGLPCRCGAGRFEAWYTSENYPPFRIGHELGGSIDCPACSAAYEIKVYSRSDVRLYRQDALEMAYAASEARYQLAEEFLKTSPVMLGIRRLLLELLGGAKTKAAKYRRLRALNLVAGSLDAFRRGYKTDETTAADVARWIFRDAERPDITEVRRQYYELRGPIVGRWLGPRTGVPFERLVRGEAEPTLAAD